MGTTASRRLRRDRDFLAAARFMVAGGFHPQAGRTTLRLAEVFADRMARSKDGHVPFSVEATARQLGLKRRAVLNHARYLRELGLLAYIEHGTKTNVLRTRYGTSWTSAHGYRGTATIFAPVAPRIWDEHLGRRITGTGYTARIAGVTRQGKRHAIEEARRTAAAKTPGRHTSCTPSSVVLKDHRQVQEVGSNNYTSRKRARGRKIPPATSLPGTSPHDCARGIALAENLQREVWWLHRSCARRLAYVLRPLIRAGWTVPSLTAELLTWGVPGHLHDPAAFVRHEIDNRRRRGALPDLDVPTVGDGLADDTGSRYRAMLRDRAKRNAATWDDYAGRIRSGLRHRLTEQRRPAEIQRRPEYRPVLREPDEDFARAVPQYGRLGGAELRDLYRTRALGGGVNTDLAVDEEALGWLDQLREQREAERACAVLAAELDDWEYERSLR